MPLTLLDILKEHSARQGLKAPAAVSPSTDGYVRQALGLLNEFNDDLNTRKFWQVNVLEAVWPATATESQGLLSAIAPSGFQGVLKGTFWNRTLRLQVDGPLDGEQWQARKAANFSGPLPSYRFRGGSLLMQPIPTAGHTLAFEYYSNWYVRSGAGAAKFMWTDAEDTCAVGDSLPLLWLRWKWKYEKGLPYAEDFAAYERACVTQHARDEGPKVIDMSQATRRPVGPGIIVPAGSWNLP